MSLVSANVAHSRSIEVAIYRAGKPALIGGRAAVVIACIYGGAAIKQGMCEGEAAVLLQGSKQRVGVDAVGGLVEAAGVAAFEVVSLRVDEAFVDKTVARIMQVFFCKSDLAFSEEEFPKSREDSGKTKFR